MKTRKSLKKIIAAAAAVVVLLVLEFCVAKFVLLAPACYADNDNLSDVENYFIKKAVLEAVEKRYSVFSGNGKNLLIFINDDFMDSVSLQKREYIIYVKGYYIEPDSKQNEFEIRMTKDYEVTFFWG